MTVQLYFNSSASVVEVQVLKCIARDEQTYAVSLDVTPFHPQGGGQPSDTGWLDNVCVTHTIMENDEIIHLTNGYLPPGKAIARIDEDARRLHSRYHSAGHIIGHILEKEGWIPIKAHHWPGEAKVTFSPTEQAQELTLESISELCSQLITENLACKVSMNKCGLREVSFGTLSPYACGGTHVNYLDEIKSIVIEKVKNKKGKLTVNYKV
ncbi:alanyl-tRNA editing protein [Photorhabdus luminescens]|uniref:alanyl-tRNA editing protein n=1 Tax=Photorhabdus luminescens TaxID=29488 RepID=UPI00223FA8B0|nr:alanyl-tRNA editing protein [Photorhabdus luminescens]MCW7760676.1 alanyl-tRNA editing protein [Photorhabdus luminescens subsp. venezuelensis]